MYSETRRLTQESIPLIVLASILIAGVGYILYDRSKPVLPPIGRAFDNLQALGSASVDQLKQEELARQQELEAQRQQDLEAQRQQAVEPQFSNDQRSVDNPIHRIFDFRFSQQQQHGTFEAAAYDGYMRPICFIPTAYRDVPEMIICP